LRIFSQTLVAMRKFSFLFFAVLLQLLLINNSHAQGLFGWLHIAPKASLGTSMLINTNVIEDENIISNPLNLSTQFGGQIGISFVDVVEFNYEYGIFNMRQGYEITADAIKYNKIINKQAIEQAVLLRFWGKSSYFELGVSQAESQNATLTNSITSNTTGSDPVFFETTDYLNTTYNSALLGFGFSPAQIELFEIDFGLRFRYAFDPIHESTGEYPIPFNDQVYVASYNNIVQTKAFSAQFQVELKYFFGFYGKAMCGSKSAIFFKKPKSFHYMD
jgi:hypothetical protein